MILYQSQLATFLQVIKISVNQVVFFALINSQIASFEVQVFFANMHCEMLNVIVSMFYFLFEHYI